jgi:hypothetical protein
MSALMGGDLAAGAAAILDHELLAEPLGTMPVRAAAPRYLAARSRQRSSDSEMKGLSGPETVGLVVPMAQTPP